MTSKRAHRCLAALLVLAAMVVALLSPFAAIRLIRSPDDPRTPAASLHERRRLSESSPAADHRHDVEHVLSLATRAPADAFTEGGADAPPLRVLVIVTTLAEYDKGTRGTSRGADRLAELVVPVLADGVRDMVARGWDVDVCLICGFATLDAARRRLIADALPSSVGLEVWTDAIPFYNLKKWNQQLKRDDQTIEPAPHGLSRQHRFVVRDKLMDYDFFTAFEDDIRVTGDHVLNFLQLSAEIDRARRAAEAAPDGLARVEDAAEDRRTTRGKSLDGSKVGNDVVEDPMTADQLRRLWPGFVRAEVLDAGDGAPHQLLGGAEPVLEHPKWAENVPAAMEYERDFGAIDPVCCDVPPGRARTPANPKKDDLLLWETDISAMGVRHYPGGIGWAAAMTGEDRADVGSYWSGEGHRFNNQVEKRPRRVDALLGQQAGWMATRSQVLYFHEHACPGGFLPPFDGKEWFNDSLQTRNGAVEFWSGGFQLFGRCSFNRILSLDPKKFSRQLLYHASNNKQKTVNRKKFVRLSTFLGQLYTVKKRALQSLKG